MAGSYGAGNYYSVIGGGYSNQIAGDSYRTTISGGGNNFIGDYDFGSFIGGGKLNSILFFPSYEFIGGGVGNTIGDQYGLAGPDSFIGGGNSNSIASGAGYAAISGGNANLIGTGASGSVIAGGQANLVNKGDFSQPFPAGTIGGGVSNRVDGDYATVPGGFGNTAHGNGSFAAGTGATAVHDHTFVWSDGSEKPAEDSGPNQFIIYATNGVGINTDGGPHNGLEVAGDINTYGSVLAGQTIRSLGVFVSDYDIYAGDSIYATNGISASTMYIPGISWLPKLQHLAET